MNLPPSSFVVALTFGLILVFSHVGESREIRPSGLQEGFYKGRCGNDTTFDVQAFIETLVENYFKSVDQSILPALLRMQFHDCFVNGCDASILIEGNSTERAADPNRTVRGFEFIDALKVQVEAKCPGLVSCADIIAIATKVVIKLGQGPDYPVQTGRRDGLRSNARDVKLPGPFMTVSQSFAFFDAKHFTLEEMVVLLGCHSVGIAHCGFFQSRLYIGSSQFDPNMDQNLREELMQKCPNNTASNDWAFLDQNPQSSNTVDNSFYDQMIKQRGILAIDQALARDPNANVTVTKALDPSWFNQRLGEAMIKLQAVEVLTGNQGNIRNVCSKFN